MLEENALVDSLENDWKLYLQDEFIKDYYLQLMFFLNSEYELHKVYPHQQEIYNALQYTSFANTKVVILGQDPYHGNGQAHGLSFSVKPGTPIPPSLRNIYKELNHDMGCSIPYHGCLISWAKQGVLLLNSVLTVREGAPNSHQAKGWERLTDRIISVLSERDQPLVFILWGSYAQKKAATIDPDKHCIITAPHPSPLSAYRGFFGSKPFSTTNQFLHKVGVQPIDWKISEC